MGVAVVPAQPRDVVTGCDVREAVRLSPGSEPTGPGVALARRVSTARDESFPTTPELSQEPGGSREPQF